MDAGRGRRCVHACVNRLLWARLRKHNDDPGTKTRKLTAFVSGFPKKRPKAGLRKHSVSVFFQQKKYVINTDPRLVVLWSQLVATLSLYSKSES